jgi:hypothetical protein
MHTPSLEMQFAICIANEEDEDLEAWKIYRVLPDPKADEVGCLRVIDESGEDYLYAQNQFMIVEFPEKVREKLLQLSRNKLFFLHSCYGAIDSFDKMC